MFGKRKNNLYQDDAGISLVPAPVGRKRGADTQRREIQVLKNVSASQLLSATKFIHYNKVLYLGGFEYAAPFAKHFESETGATLISVQQNLNVSHYQAFFQDYSFDYVPDSLPAGKGCLTLLPYQIHDLLRMLQSWPCHTFILLPGGGMNLSEELLNCMFHHKLLIITDSLYQGLPLNVHAEDIFRRSNGIILGSDGTLTNELASFIGSFDAKMASTVMGLTWQPVPELSHSDTAKVKRRFGFNWQQSYQIQDRPILSPYQRRDIYKQRQVICLDLHSPVHQVYVAGPLSY